MTGTMTQAELSRHIDASTTEKQFQAQVVALAKVRGWLVAFTLRSKGSPAGEPDLRMVRVSEVECPEGTGWRSPNDPREYEAILICRERGCEHCGMTGKVQQARLIFAELKVKGRKPTAAQAEWLEALALVPGVEVHLWYPEDWPEIEAVLK